MLELIVFVVFLIIGVFYILVLNYHFNKSYKVNHIGLWNPISSKKDIVSKIQNDINTLCKIIVSNNNIGRVPLILDTTKLSILLALVKTAKHSVFIFARRFPEDLEIDNFLIKKLAELNVPTTILYCNAENSKEIEKLKCCKRVIFKMFTPEKSNKQTIKEFISFIVIDEKKYAILTKGTHELYINNDSTVLGELLNLL